MLRSAAFLLLFSLGLVFTSVVGAATAGRAAGQVAPVDVMVTYQGDGTGGGRPAVQCSDPCPQNLDPSHTADG